MTAARVEEGQLSLERFLSEFSLSRAAHRPTAEVQHFAGKADPLPSGASKITSNESKGRKL